MSGVPKKTKHTIRRTSIVAQGAHNQNLILPGQTTNAAWAKRSCNSLQIVIKYR